MKVGVLSMYYPSSHDPFFGTFVKDELDSLADFVDIRLLSPFYNQYFLGEDHSFTASHGYPVLRPFSPGFPQWFFQSLSTKSLSISISLVREFFSGCDLIHAHNAFPDGVAAVTVLSRQYPIVVTVHGSDVNVNAMNPSLRPEIVRSLNSSSRILAVSGSLKNTLEEIGVTAKIEIIPNGVNTSLFTPGEKKEACRKLGFDPDCPRIIFIGNFLPVKGIEYLIGSFPAVLRSRPECELVLVGAKPGGKDSRAYQNQIRELGIGQQVRICEKVTNCNLPDWIRASDVLVLPSISEGFGIVAVEALACGRPVVATRCGGPEEIVKEGLGFIVPPRDPESLGDAIIKALDRRGILGPEQLAESARERFSLSEISKRIVAVYEDV
ncbi:MAG: glycosyltransferase family 4 protein [Candidatus Latescibacterota bacterium]